MLTAPCRSSYSCVCIYINIIYNMYICISGALTSFVSQTTNRQKCYIYVYIYDLFTISV